MGTTPEQCQECPNNAPIFFLADIMLTHDLHMCVDGRIDGMELPKSPPAGAGYAVCSRGAVAV